ncbi:MAG TPA: DUF4185 domain-containing protein [Terriglobales bacterium]|nr:DUF4185 domain-containing protein [Terriglobales bacterium]
MKRQFVSVSLFLILLSAATFGAENQHFDCTPSFPFHQQWQGADAAYSIPLQDGRVVWIFGDTLYGNERLVNGEEPRMVHNTIGISTCKNGNWNIDYTIKQDVKGSPDSFFKPQQNDGTYYWALDGVENNHELWITLVCVRNVPNSNAFALGFEVCGTDLAHVTGLEGDPQNWKAAYFPLVPESVHANPSASALIKDDYLYIYTLYEIGSRPQILTRIPLKGLTDPKKSLQYLGSDDQWHDGIEPAKAKEIMTKGASEMSVRYHPELKKWIAVMVDPQIFSDKVIFRTAPSLAGPWTDGEVIYRIPILQKSDPKYDADTFCYAGKEHPEFEKSGELLFTYVCNTMKPKKLPAETNIYFPQVVRMPMPAAATK